MGARVEAEQFGKDVIVLKNMVKDLHPDPKTQPKVLGPSGFYDEKWFNVFLEVSVQGVVDGVTYHIYNLGPGFENEGSNKCNKRLNALLGRNESQSEKGLWAGDWNSQNARDFMKYTISKGYKVDSYEFGNQLSGAGMGARFEAEQYVKDIIVLKNMVKDLHLDPKTQPKVLGPSGFDDEKWFNVFLEVSGQGVVDGVTHHIYNLGPGDGLNLITKIQDPSYLNQVAQTYRGVLILSTSLNRNELGFQSVELFSMVLKMCLQPLLMDFVFVKMDLKCIFGLVIIVSDIAFFTLNVNVVIQGSTPIAETDDNFICATLDWWPTEKCNYNQCPWGKRFIWVLSGCLPMERWDKPNNFFNQTGGVKVTFGLNALLGRNESQSEKGLWAGDWNSQNARDFMKYTISRGYKVDSYEFGNQLSEAGMGARVEAEQYGKDVIVLENMVKDLHPDPKTQPKVLGPSGFYDEKWFNVFLEVSGQGVVDGVTHHIYNLGPGDGINLITKIQDPSYLNQVAQTYRGVFNIVNKYFDQLGMASTYNHKVFCRQTLIGGNYALLNTTTFIPNPDYYGALLWHRLMGSIVLAVTQVSNPNLRVYAHCAKKKPGVSIIFINLSKDSSFDVTLSSYEHHRRNLRSTDVAKPNFEFTSHLNREEYHLTALGGDIQGQIVLLNDVPMVPTDTFDIPAMDPKLVNASTPISVAAHSIVYVTIRDFHAPVCV
ncbi:heparanase-like protein 2 [Gossypium arboreum]|uniref:heparanase-like protein 2 n=1 Tax=Gossypium arboreum TaxID=29729 RepID=UPI0022F1CC9F|nr:heparanase-like protein 2 [Gossypium arboreum]